MLYREAGRKPAYKWVWIFLAVLVTAINGCGPKEQFTPDIVGEWSGTEASGEVRTFLFYRGGDVVVLNNGRPVLSNDQITSDGYLAYEFDTKVTPYRLDIVLTHFNGTEMSRFPMLVEFLKKDEIRIATCHGKKIPASFDTDKDTTVVTLKRVRAFE